jgi:integrase
MTCRSCGAELPANARRNKRYCDARCRRRAFEDRRAPLAPELAPVVPIGDEERVQEQHVQELLARVLREERLVGLVAAGAKTNWRAAA